MDKKIPILYKKYGEYVNTSRAFPLDIDGLKPAERRVLLSSYLIARDKFVKSARVDGHVIGNFHPHSSVYGTIVQLVRNKHLLPQGNFGCDFGVESVGAAASRYTEIKMPKSTSRLAFNLIDYVVHEINELGVKEPNFLPTMFPICLFNQEFTQGIGFGYKTYVPCYHIKDLYNRLLWLLGKKKQRPTIKPITDCNITSPNSDLETLLTTGKGKIEVEGIFKIDNRHNSIILKSWPPGRKFESFLNKFSQELNNQDIGFTDSSVTETEIVFQVIKQRNRDNIFKKTIEKMKEAVKGSISFESIVVDINQNVKLKSIDNMLLDTFNMFSNVNKGMLEVEITKLNILLSEYEALIKIRPFLSKVLNLKLDAEESIEEIHKRSKVDKDIIKLLFNKYRISKLLHLKVDLDKTVEEINDKVEKIKNLQNFVLSQYEELKI